MTSPYVTSINDELCLLQNPIHEKIKYSYLSKTKYGYVHSSSSVIKTQIKLLEHITWNSVILEIFLKDKPMKEFLSEINIVTTFSTEEIISQNKCQIGLLEILVLKKDVDKNWW